MNLCVSLTTLKLRRFSMSIWRGHDYTQLQKPGKEGGYENYRFYLLDYEEFDAAALPAGVHALGSDKCRV